MRKTTFSAFYRLYDAFVSGYKIPFGSNTGAITMNLSQLLFTEGQTSVGICVVCHNRWRDLTKSVSILIILVGLGRGSKLHPALRPTA